MITTSEDAVRFPNNLHAVRVQEGLSKTTLARIALLSERTIRIVESGERRPREETMHRILNAINHNSARVKKEEYSFEEVFPPNQATLF